MKQHLLALAILLVSAIAYAGDYHQDGQGHRVSYVIVDTAGNPVAGQTVNLSVERSNDGYFLDFSDNTFKASGWSSRMTTLNYDSTGEYYYRVITIDNAVLVTGDYCAIVSNENVTYADHDVECFNFDDLNNLIKINN